MEMYLLSSKSVFFRWFDLVIMSDILCCVDLGWSTFSSTDNDDWVKNGRRTWSRRKRTMNHFAPAMDDWSIVLHFTGRSRIIQVFWRYKDNVARTKLMVIANDHRDHSIKSPSRAPCLIKTNLLQIKVSWLFSANSSLGRGSVYLLESMSSRDRIAQESTNSDRNNE